MSKTSKILHHALANADYVQVLQIFDAFKNPYSDLINLDRNFPHFLQSHSHGLHEKCKRYNSNHNNMDIVHAFAVCSALSKGNTQQFSDAFNNLDSIQRPIMTNAIASHPYSLLSSMLDFLLVNSDEHMRSQLLKAAAQSNKTDKAQHILQRKLPSEKIAKALVCAATRGNLDMVKYLSTQTKATSLNSGPLVAAASEGHEDCVDFLISVSNPKSDNSRPLRMACKNSHTQIALTLLPLSEPDMCQSEALYWACHNRNDVLIQALYPHSKSQQVINRLCSENRHVALAEFKEFDKSQKLSKILTAAVEDQSPTSHAKRKM